MRREAQEWAANNTIYGETKVDHMAPYVTWGNMKWRRRMKGTMSPLQ